ncbi:MAG: hypothetical protein GY705_05005 [Bacteroidetes bacterium]|nr:hypothetical protein [Bacteroidota bacterium]
MEIKIRYEDLMNLIKQLPSNQLDKLKSDIVKLIQKTNNTESQPSDFQKFLLSGPTMTDQQFDQFQEKRKQFEIWRTS